MIGYAAPVSRLCLARLLNETRGTVVTRGHAVHTQAVFCHSQGPYT